MGKMRQKMCKFRKKHEITMKKYKNKKLQEIQEYMLAMFEEDKKEWGQRIKEIINSPSVTAGLINAVANRRSKILL